jgi:putative transposase
MINFKFIIQYIKNWWQIFSCFFKTRFMSDIAKDLEILALRSQLSIFQQEILNHKSNKPRFTHAFRQFWVLLSKFFSNWKSSLFLVKPETVIKWHKTAFKFYWALKSKKPGRPKISRKTIALIKRIHIENPLLSPEKIYERLIDMSIIDAPSPNTIAKYIKNIRKPPSSKQKQSWKTFISNHTKGLWAMDFFIVPTLYFKVLHVLIIINHERRKIEHFAITSVPTSSWVIQQLKEATPFGKHPKYLLHDNSSLFTSELFQEFLICSNIIDKRTAVFSPFQNPICERMVGITRAELLNHVIPFNENHLHYLLKQYFDKYYHPVRTHQGLYCQTPLLSAKLPKTPVKNTHLTSSPILGGLYHSYNKVA